MAADRRCRVWGWTRPSFCGRLRGPNLQPKVARYGTERAHQRHMRAREPCSHGMSETQENGILIHGSSTTARVTALALAQARLPVMLADRSPLKAPDAASEDWQSVLALSPAAKTMLEALGVWQELDRPSAPICDMAVYGDRAAYAADLGLDFALPETDDSAVAILAHVVSRAALDRAVESAVKSALAAGRINGHGAPLTAFDKTTGEAQFDDGDIVSATLLIDCARKAASWRQFNNARMFHHDYRAGALVCALESDTAHGNQAIQIFTPDGPLALLPLPDKHSRALIWSMPQARARALAGIDAPVFSHELQKATDQQFGRTSPITRRTVQPLTLALAEHYVDEKGASVYETINLKATLTDDAAIHIHDSDGNLLQIQPTKNDGGLDSDWSSVDQGIAYYRADNSHVEG